MKQEKEKKGNVKIGRKEKMYTEVKWERGRKMKKKESENRKNGKAEGKREGREKNGGKCRE